MIRENVRNVSSGYLMLIVLVILQLATAYGIYSALRVMWVPGLILAVLASIVVLIMWAGLFMIHPNEAKVLQLFGKYVGTAHEPGLKWANPFYQKTAVSTRVRNFESGKLKVNDSNGSPIEIAAVVVWKVVDTAEALFEVDDYEEFVQIQSESALRNLSTTYPYEPHEGDGLALRSDPVEIAQALREEIQDRLDTAGVTVIEARISHLAYAPEIANAMLRRQQASAIIAARRQIVSGAVGMVEMALDELRQNQVIELDEERKAAMVSNLLVVLCGEEGAQPVLNTGSLYT
ncbi:MAG: SPFH domain-containing protein [Gammaproteobacteria bacterium]|jgi:regulator of protease activity HflC (stomatin/prohibitin superfamily)|nr:SPFH domain-containing protein [Gammaproteobacteria bacterium]MDH3933177.1 SPFH domain-containing protein [Chromatiales bacterium]MDH3847047.1 SPFH domain-containing protein [Gammaproteobacteria bacterium]MDH3863757.1 SPFH domain-containing protein [Gammaproteobacteria bacterium]MDH3905719.1 SPFH domain-containing protein [Gammaproteobacteria bacterium]